MYQSSLFKDNEDLCMLDIEEYLIMCMEPNDVDVSLQLIAIEGSAKLLLLHSNNPRVSTCYKYFEYHLNQNGK